MIYYSEHLIKLAKVIDLEFKEIVAFLVMNWVRDQFAKEQCGANVSFNGVDQPWGWIFIKTSTE
jgi:hypothetical protein